MIIGGAELAGLAMAAELVDEVVVQVHPVLVGGGASAWSTGPRAELRLRGERRFPGGVVSLRYDVVR
jgi:dihydrofolate reductase